MEEIPELATWVAALAEDIERVRAELESLEEVTGAAVPARGVERGDVVAVDLEDVDESGDYKIHISSIKANSKSSAKLPRVW